MKTYVSFCAETAPTITRTEMISLDIITDTDVFAVGSYEKTEKILQQIESFLQ